MFSLPPVLRMLTARSAYNHNLGALLVRVVIIVVAVVVAAVVSECIVLL